MQPEAGRAADVVPSRASIDSIHAQVQKILANHRFATSARHSRLFQFLVTHTLEPGETELKEYVLGVEVFDRGDSFDPQTDPIVRTELSRLRAKLRAYYDSDGADDDIIVRLPHRSHSLEFELRKQAVHASQQLVAEPPGESPAETSRAASVLLGFADKRKLAVLTLLVVIIIGFAESLVWVQAGSQTARHGRPHIAPTTVAVFPFVNLNRDPEMDSLSEGLTEQLIHFLTEIEGVQVVSRRSALPFTEKSEDVHATVRRLNVAMILEGTVRRSGGRVRITTRWVNAADGFHLDSQVCDREFQDAVSLQVDIARQIANRIRAYHVGGPIATAVRQLTTNPGAYQLYVLGRRHARNRSETELWQAIRYYERSIAADASYAPAHAALADALIALALLNEAPPQQVLRRAKEAAERAVSTGAALGGFSRAHSTLGSIRSLYDRDWVAAAKEFRAAMALDPNDQEIRQAYALHYLLPQKKLDSALFEMQLAHSLDPSSPEAVRGLGKVHHFKREPDRAIKSFQRVLQLAPDYESAPLLLASAYLQKSQLDQAIKTLLETSVPTEDEARLAMLGHAYALSREPARARQMLAQLSEVARERYVSGYYFAIVHLSLGDFAAALDALEDAAEDRCPLTVYLRVDPHFDKLRGEPRFQTLLRSVGLGG